MSSLSITDNTMDLSKDLSNDLSKDKNIYINIDVLKKEDDEIIIDRDNTIDNDTIDNDIIDNDIIDNNDNSEDTNNYYEQNLEILEMYEWDLL